jgi:hypothetical protein
MLWWQWYYIANLIKPHNVKNREKSSNRSCGVTVDIAVSADVFSERIK